MYAISIFNHVFAVFRLPPFSFLLRSHYANTSHQFGLGQKWVGGANSRLEMFASEQGVAQWCQLWCHKGQNRYEKRKIKCSVRDTSEMFWQKYSLSSGTMACFATSRFYSSYKWAFSTSMFLLLTTVSPFINLFIDLFIHLFTIFVKKKKKEKIECRLVLMRPEQKSC